MDTREFPKGLVVEDDDHMNEILGPGGLVETGVDNLQVDFEVTGVIDGLAVTEHAGTPDMTIDVSTGVAYDGSGKRCKVSTGQNVDLSGVSLPSPGNEKWVSIYIANAVENAEAWIDDEGVSGYWEHNDSFSITYVAGAEGSPPATRPSLHATKRILADVKLTNGMTQILNADIDTSRRESCRILAANSQREISQDLIPDTDDTYTCGSSSKKWSEVNSAGDMNADANVKGETFEITSATRIGAIAFDSTKSYRRVHSLGWCRPDRTAANAELWKFMRQVTVGTTHDLWKASIQTTDTDRYYLRMPLLFSDGASLGRVRCSVYQDADADTDITLSVWKVTEAGARTQIGSSVILGSFGSWQTLQTATLSETIDNESYSYYAEVEGAHSAAIDHDSYLRSYSATQSYSDIGRAPGW